MYALFRCLFILLGCCFAKFAHNQCLRKTQFIFLLVVAVVGAFLPCPVCVQWFIVDFIGSLLETRDIRRNMSTVLMFSTYLCIFVESCNSLSYKFVWVVDSCVQFFFRVNLHVNVTTVLAAGSFVCILLLATRLNVVDTNNIRLMSVRRSNLVISLFGLFTMFLFKCYLGGLDSHTEYYELMWNIMLFMIIIYFTTYVAMRKISKLHAVDVNYTVDTAIGKALCSSECSLDFRLPDKTFAYEREKLHFSCELSRFGLDYGFLGYSQLVLCLIVLSNTKHEESEIDRIVCSCMEPFADLSKKNIFELLDDVLANARLVEKIDPDAYEHIDDDVKTGRELLKYFLKVA